MSRTNRKHPPPPLYDLISLENHVGLVTGAGAGIGKAIAYRLAEAEADLHLVDVNQDSLNTVKKELSKFRVHIETHKVDLSKKEEIDALWDKLNGNEPDILVNNAGIYPFKNFLKVDENLLRKVLNINMNAVFWMCQRMIRQRLGKGGVIINVGSIEALMPFERDIAHYDMSKAGVIALTRALAKQYGNHDFRINVIIPGGIMTEGTKNVAKDFYKLGINVIKSGVEFKLRLPIGRFGKPDEVARIALVLASDLSSYVHGALFVVDGGFLSA